jgi:hypothetical protein
MANKKKIERLAMILSYITLICSIAYIGFQLYVAYVYESEINVEDWIKIIYQTLSYLTLCIGLTLKKKNIILAALITGIVGISCFSILGDYQIISELSFYYEVQFFLGFTHTISIISDLIFLVATISFLISLLEIYLTNSMKYTLIFFYIFVGFSFFSLIYCIYVFASNQALIALLGIGSYIIGIVFGTLCILVIRAYFYEILDNDINK